MIFVITKGAHWRETSPAIENPDRQFAHEFDPNEAEDVPHQAHNFLTYAHALGESKAPHILIAPPDADDPAEDAHLEIQMADWCMIVQSATGVPVEIL